MKRVNINLPEELHRHALDYCEANNFTFTELIRHLLREEFGNHTSPMPLNLPEQEKKPELKPLEVGKPIKPVARIDFYPPKITQGKKIKVESCTHGIIKGGFCKACVFG